MTNGFETKQDTGSILRVALFSQFSACLENLTKSVIVGKLGSILKEGKS